MKTETQRVCTISPRVAADVFLHKKPLKAKRLSSDARWLQMDFKEKASLKDSCEDSQNNEEALTVTPSLMIKFCTTLDTTSLNPTSTVPVRNAFYMFFLFFLRHLQFVSNSCDTVGQIVQVA